MFSTENPINVTEVPVLETDEDWGFTKAETVGINLGLVPRQKSSLHFLEFHSGHLLGPRA